MYNIDCCKPDYKPSLRYPHQKDEVTHDWPYHHPSGGPLRCLQSNLRTAGPPEAAEGIRNYHCKQMTLGM